MVTINCAGVAETLLESELFGHVRGSLADAHRDSRSLFAVAHGGTVPMHEVGDQTIVDVRVISATNRDLFEHTQRKEFREDLYYRLNVVCLSIPHCVRGETISGCCWTITATAGLSDVALTGSV